MRTQNNSKKSFVEKITAKTIYLYDRLILANPLRVLVASLVVLGFLILFLPKFKFDASADTLLLKNDPALEYYRSIKARYGSDDYIIITYTPKKELFTKQTLNDILYLRNELRALDNITSVVSVLDVPLIKKLVDSNGVEDSKIVTLENGNIEIPAAKEKFYTNPIYKDLLVSKDGKTTALLVTLDVDRTYLDIVNRQNILREKRLTTELSLEEQQELKKLTKKIADSREELNKQQAFDVEEIRSVIAKHNKNAELFIGGVPMIVADSIGFIKSDVVVFGVVIVLLLVLIIKLIFTNIYLICLPLLSCTIVGVAVGGLLGLLNWPVSVVSSNFLPLLLIFTLSFTIHIVVRYIELGKKTDIANHKEIIAQSVKEKFKPCLYAAITTMVAFGSLLVSGVQPLIDFGLIMSVGLMVSFIVVFTFFAASFMLLHPKKSVHVEFNVTAKIMRFISNNLENYKKTIWIIFTLLCGFSFFFITKLNVENRFIDYFKESTEIYQGMETIDERLGGTTPLDIIIDPPKDWVAPTNSAVETSDINGEYDEYSADLGGDAGLASTSYWFNVDQINFIRKIHNYLESINETGKVLSLATTMDFLKNYDEQAVNSNFYLSVLYNTVPDYVKETLFNPYLSKDGNQIRFSIRVYESDSNLNRKELLTKIKSGLKDNFNLTSEQAKPTGMFVLYNNMLESFFKSQISTIGIIFICIFLTFIILFKNFKLGVIAIIPNMFAGAFVLGLMGLFGIPLDLMTIAIASICIGISVDDTIHYFDRFIVEYHANGNSYWDAIKRCHNTVGFAMYYTTITITIGFSVLVFSNFVPTIYFGILTGCAMLVALMANLFLLPLLIVALKLKAVPPVSKQKDRLDASTVA